MTSQKSRSEIVIIIKNTLILFAITAIAGLLLSIVNSLTLEPIAQQKMAQRDMALKAVIADPGQAQTKFQELDFDQADQYPKIQQIFAAQDTSGNQLGYAFILENKGYGGPINLVAGIKLDGTISGMDVMTHSETPGLGANADTDWFKSRLTGKTAEKLYVAKGDNQGQHVDALSGATITTTALVDAINEAIDYYQSQLKGGH